MKTAKKALLLALCAIALVVATVMGTLAYLQDQTDVVKNTMTVGMVDISMDEAKVDVYGAKDGDTRVMANTYKLIPGHEYIKDPVVTVDKDSEDAFIYVKVVNEISDIETAGTNVVIAEQIIKNGWTVLEGVDNVYYRNYDLDENATNDVTYKVFESFKIAGDAAVENYVGKTITVEAYAVQADGFDTAVAAWEAADFN